jgi:hypothetical protein
MKYGKISDQKNTNVNKENDANKPLIEAFNLILLIKMYNNKTKVLFWIKKIPHKKRD